MHHLGLFGSYILLLLHHTVSFHSSVVPLIILSLLFGLLERLQAILSPSPRMSSISSQWLICLPNRQMTLVVSSHKFFFCFATLKQVFPFFSSPTHPSSHPPLQPCSELARVLSPCPRFSPVRSPSASSQTSA